jgi:hypothetical protein
MPFYGRLPQDLHDSEPGLQKESLSISQNVHIAAEDTRGSSVAAGRNAVALTPGTKQVHKYKATAPAMW